MRNSTEAHGMAKWKLTENARKIAAECMQLHGGYGYMEEYEIARRYRDIPVALTNISFYIYISMILLTVTMLASCEQKETSSINDQKEMKEQQISEELFESFKSLLFGAFLFFQRNLRRLLICQKKQVSEIQFNSKRRIILQ